MNIAERIIQNGIWIDDFPYICKNCRDKKSDFFFICENCGKMFYYNVKEALYHKKKQENDGWQKQKHCSVCNQKERCHGCGDLFPAYKLKGGYCWKCNNTRERKKIMPASEEQFQWQEELNKDGSKRLPIMFCLDTDWFYAKMLKGWKENRRTCI